MQNFNVAPYFDDFSDEKNFYKTLFVPTRPVQARELNQIQSILQNQIESHANHVFKNGTMVIPGHVYYDPNIKSIRLVKLFNDVSADLIIPNLVGKTLVGADTGIKALVVHYDASTNNDSPIVYVKFTSASTNGEEVAEFKNGEVVYDEANAGTKVKLESLDAVSAASIVTVNEGIYYVNGYFVRVARQTITLEKYTNKPTWRAGLEVKESIVTAVEDNSLYDNALGYSNFAAPGADRYKIELTLSKRSFNFDDQETVDEDGNVLEEKFIDLIQVKNGNVILEVNSTEYSEIEKIFARRTYDESGDYEVKPFQVSAVEYRNNIRGDWKTGTAYLEGDYVRSDSTWWECLNDGVSGPTAPQETVGYKVNDGNINWVMINTVYSNLTNHGVYTADDADSLTTQRENAEKIIYKVSPGKAYISGFETELKSDQMIESTKALTYEHVENEIIPAAAGTYAKVTNLRGFPNISSYEIVDLYNYTRAELASFDTDKRTATATNTEVGTITTITITDMGYGYDRFNPPTAVVTSGGGTGAILKVIVAHTGEIQEIRVINGGTGYNGNQVVTISAPAADAPKIGTCRVRSMDYDEGTIGSASCVFRLQIFDVDLLPDYTWGLHVKSMLSQGASGYAADLVEDLVRLNGLVNTTTGSKVITGVGTNFLSDLVSGQYIRIGSAPVYNNTTGAWVSGGHRRKTSWVVPQADGSLTLPYNFTQTLTSQTIDAVYSSIYSVSASLIAPFTKEYLRNVRSSDDTTIATTYTVHRHFNTLTPTAGVITITLNVDGETFAPITGGNFLVSVISTGEILAAPVMSLNPTAKTLTISGLAATAHEVLTTIEKTSTAAREKTKTRAIKTFDITNIKTLEKAIIALNEADVYRIVRVLKADGEGVLTGSDYEAWATASLNGVSDITHHFILDNGQTPMFYGLGKLSKKKDCPKLNNTVRIVFEYFNHSAGDFFTVNSYVDVARDKIDTILRDTIDFRPRIADDGLTFLPANGASITEPTSLNTHFKVNYSYYLPRVDIVTIDQNTKLEVLHGEPGFSLKEPLPKSSSLTIALSRLAPGTFSVNSESVQVVKKAHKRYTMSDIGNLDRRITNLEYYAQLSMLEKDAINTNVVDQNGLDRFKAGILTDSFNSQAVSDPSHPDFFCAIDFEQGECRAFAESTSIDLKEVALSEAQRAANHYTMTGDIVSLPYTNVICVEQPLASRTELVNPFAVVTFNGEMALFPSQDSWMEEKVASTITINKEGNYNTVKAIAEAKGQLGTRWNSWQTNWTGITFNLDQNNAWVRRWGNRWLDGEGFRARVTGMLESGNIPTGNQFLGGHLGIGVTQNFAGLDQGWGNQGVVGTVSAKGSRTRTGTITQLNEEFSKTIDDRTIETNIIPTMRSRPIVIKATGMKPNTRLYPFFGGIDVSKYIVQLSEFVVSGSITGTFRKYEDGVVDDEDNPARLYPVSRLQEITLGSVAQQKGVLMDRGDICFVYNGATNTGASAIVVDVIEQRTNGVYETVVKIVGLKNSSTFDWASPPTNWTGYTIRSASGNASCSVIEYRAPTTLVTNSTGTTYCVFVIPNSNETKFNTGSLLFKLTDTPTNNDNLSTTSASAAYTASGILQIKERTITNVRNAGDIVTRDVSQTEDVNQTLFIAGRGDPLAQTFMISEVGGAFITQAEVYVAVKDAELPLRCEIRSVVNGYPGPDVISRVSKLPEDIVVNATGLTPTVFTFPTPVYLVPNVEYCIVLLSDSTKYQVWIARMGEQIIGTNRLITTQPSLGSLFKSQNNSTWTAEQYDDLTFKLYKAKFDISRASNIGFVNKRLATVIMLDNPMTTVSGSNIVRVNQRNHGFVEGDSVTISGIYNGIAGPFAALGTTYLAGDEVTDKATYIVSNTEHDFYTIEIVDAAGVAVPAAYSTQFGGNEAEATYHVAYSTMFPNFQVQNFPETSASLAVTTMKGDPVNAYNTVNSGLIANRQNKHFTSMMMIASQDNESKYLAKDKSFKAAVTLSSTSEDLSPVIDTQRCSMILVNNVINAPTLENHNVAAFDDVTVCTNKTITFLYSASLNDDIACGSYFETTDATIFDDFDKITAGKSITATTGLNTGFTFVTQKSVRLTVGGVPTYRVYVRSGTTFVSGTSTSNSTLVLHTRFVNEHAPYNTSTLSSYVSQAMRTAVPGTGVRITLDANVPTGTMIYVYHRSMVANSLIPLHEQCWKEVPSLIEITTTADFNNMTEYTFELLGIPAYDVGQVKVTFTSENPAITPRISALRMMSLA